MELDNKMSNTQDFIKSEKDYYGKLFVDITYAIDNVSPLMDPSIFKTRKYVSKLPILKKYMDLLDAAEQEQNKKKGFFGMFSSDNSVGMLNDYKRQNNDGINQLKKCQGCACLNCTVECKFDSCLGCREGAHVASCDHKKINVVFHDNFNLQLINNRTGATDSYRVLATLQDVDMDEHFIITQNKQTNEKFILYYYIGISEDSYGEITDPQIFDYIASTFSSVEE